MRRFSDAELDLDCVSCGRMIGDHRNNQIFCRGRMIDFDPSQIAAEITPSPSPPPMVFSGFAIVRPTAASPSPPPPEAAVRTGLAFTRPLDVLPVISKSSIPTEFVPRYTNDTSHSLFPPTTTNARLPRRFINQDNPKQFLIYTDGACLNNGQANPKGGCSAVFRPPTRTRQYFGRISFALEHRGPTGKLHQQTSNRAELRAVIAALRFRSWDGEGFNSLVIATDSTYVVEGSTSWVYAWMRNGWETRAGTPVKNQDLWQCLFDEIEKAHRSSLRIQFWHIPREWNEWADLYAKEGAEMTRRDYFKDIVSSEEY